MAATVKPPKTTAKLRVLPRVTCPHCWERFPPEKILWISEHTDLLGDPRLGPEAQQRFLPTRFRVSGEALDVKGFPCYSLACPQCHLPIPRALLEMDPLFLSIFGAPGSGKSFFLAAMTWELRRVLPLEFRVSFGDADPAMNQSLNEYEESLFANPESERTIPLADLIRKTELQGELYDSVSYGSQTVNYARPFLFTMQPQYGHPNEAKGDRLGRVVCLYDNAGEHFQPGQDTAASPVTRHMAQSRVLFFLFDPTQDMRFREFCRERTGVDPAPRNARMIRQEPVLQEAAARIRRYASLRQTDKHQRPLVVILTKFDRWAPLIQEDEPGEPWRRLTSGRHGSKRSTVDLAALDTGIVERRSEMARSVLRQVCPEIIGAAEGFAQDVVYVPVSAVGSQAHLDESSGMLCIRPSDTKPHWVTIPFIYAMCRWAPGLVPSVRKKENGRGK